MNHKAFAEMIDSATAYVTIVQDGGFSNAAISLLCRIEHFNNQIDRPQTSEKRLAAIGVACEILVEMIDFCSSTGIVESRESKELLANFVDRKNQVEILLKKQTWSEMIGRDLESSRKKEQEYAQLGVRFEDMFRKRFTILGQQVNDPIQSQEWQEGWSTVVTEFSTRW
jgi:hypothetical protein